MSKIFSTFAVGIENNSTNGKTLLLNEYSNSPYYTRDNLADNREELAFYMRTIYRVVRIAF